MSTPRAAFPDLELLVLDAIAAGLGIAGGTVTPDDLQDQLPFVRAHRIGGPDNGITDQATIVLDQFAATLAAAKAAAESIRQLLTAGPTKVDGRGVIDQAVTVSGPAEVPWNVTNSPRRIVTTYRVAARR